MSQMVELLNFFPLADGASSESRLEGVRFFKSTQPLSRKPMVYEPGICIVAQGHKIGYLGDRKFQYDANNYLVTSVTMPFECETFASPEDPLLGLYIDIDMAQLHDLIGRLDLQAEIGQAGEKGLPRGIGPAVMDEDMADAINRLLKCLQSETESQILGPGLVREILYRALCGTQAPVLYSLAMHGGTFSQVARALSRQSCALFKNKGDLSKRLLIQPPTNKDHQAINLFCARKDQQIPFYEPLRKRANAGDKVKKNEKWNGFPQFEKAGASEKPREPQF